MSHRFLIAMTTVGLLTACAPRPSPVPAATSIVNPVESKPSCPGAGPGLSQVYWGDLHVHTAYSLDAFSYGTLATPKEAFRFAKGEKLKLMHDEFQLDRPLDFLAVTDHAEWFDVMYTCTDPMMSTHPYCVKLRQNSSPETGGTIFRDFVNPTITEAKPARADICAENPDQCDTSRASQWLRVQDQANDANDPCAFTAFIGFEWSATPSYSHTHRNVIFENDKVTPTAIDYIRFPQVAQLWEQLDAGCRATDGCDAITLPHNNNFGDGQSFDVETESDRTLMLRTRYERLMEIVQEKGASECLAPFGERQGTNTDCAFEQYIVSRSRPKDLSDFTQDEWERMRGSYARGLLGRGLAAYDASGNRQQNPLQLGFVGSTDSHTGLGGYVEEDQWQGSVFGMGNLERTMSRLGFNPGGLVAIWAPENTRESLFSALKRREVYATSGPRITVRFDAIEGGGKIACEKSGIMSAAEGATPMGGTLPGGVGAPQFRIHAAADKHSLSKIEIVRGTFSGGATKEDVVTVWQPIQSATQVCTVWADNDFNASTPTFWYARILEEPTPRWSSFKCKEAGRCDEFPGADQMIQERAWASPIWYLPPTQ